ncbi:2,4'-dihydroxyacetophenone dioxygenase family protein [Mycobacterium shigaense]|uniref:2,4'-dihydroxyacetophenone dioxygenase family protein n=1 Tax=Mycobacterium shigaense TaxID=722731 RepID=UPI002ADF2D66|nr:2,4'-dihydroxyacetophenone dioxygenase family protein [Mycobacterium shigaense]MEA1122017.1 2,4'-dihydroxyacetophenone dioxygenase family protein [Mycobacterium shigaense]
MQVLQELDVNYMKGADNPWIPFTPLTDEVFLKYWKIDPVRAEIIVSMKFNAGLVLPAHYHTGIVVGHTVSGAWRYQENDWISRAGDTVYEVAGSSHTPESLEETEVFFFLVGELLFLDQDNKILWQENYKTSVDRYSAYCAANGITPRDLTSWDA